MKLFKIIAWVGFALTVAPPVLNFVGSLELEMTKHVMFVGMVLWFIGATPWLGSNQPDVSDKSVEI